MRDLIVICGSVRASEYGHVRRLMHRGGIKPQAVRLDLTPLLANAPRKSPTGLRDRQNEISPGEDRYNYDPNYTARAVGLLEEQHPDAQHRACAFICRESDFAATSKSDLYEIASSFDCYIVDLDNRASLKGLYAKLGRMATT